MQFSPRSLTLNVLLLLMLSFLAVNVHAATHISSGNVNCDLCAGFTDPPDAAIASELEFSVVPRGYVHATDQFAVRSLLINETSRARGPPARNQMTS